jgi:hypothetical protein
MTFAMTLDLIVSARGKGIGYLPISITMNKMSID